MRAWSGLAIAVTVSLAVACSARERTNPTVIRDSLGAEFAWTCTDTVCKFGSSPSTPEVPPACRKVGGDWGWVSGRFFSTCCFFPFATGSEIVTGSCRPIVCATDDDCPWADFGTTFTCQAGLCESDAPLGWRDAMAMCLVTQPRIDWCAVEPFDHSGPYKDVTLHVLETCPLGVGRPCTVPSDCRQP